MASPGHACSQSSVPSAGATLVAPASLSSRICATPSIVDELRRAVAAAAVRAEPARIAGGEVVGGERAGGGDDDEVADHQRRAREAPARDLRAGVGRRVARPHDGAVAGVERVQDSGRAKRVDATVAEGRRRARTGAGIRLPEPGRVAVSPHRLAGGHVVAGDDLVVAALLLGVEEVAADREGRPARSDRPAPQLDRRRRGPVGLDPHAANDAVAIGSAKAGPVGSRLAAARGGECRGRRRSWRGGSLGPCAAGGVGGAGRLVGAWPAPLGGLGCCRSRRERRRLVAGLGQEPFLGSLRPPPVEVANRPSPVMPPVRRSVHAPHASRMVATIDARRGPSERRRLATAQATKARLRTGMA